MSVLTYRANLKASQFPLLSELFGQSVIVRNQDQNYFPGVTAKEAMDSSVGIPQIYYCHNVVPTEAGYKSVGYSEITGQQFDPSTNFTDIVTIRDASNNVAKLAVDASGNVYIMPFATTSWITGVTPPNPALVAGKRMTVAFVEGVTYIYFSGVGCYTYTWGINTFSTVTLTGLTASAVLGILSNQGYLIAYTIDTIAWSSTISAIDFTPSLATGAGGGQIEGARGQIVSVVAVYGGFIIFTTTNAVAGMASNNVRYPYNFVEINGCGGLISTDYVSEDADSSVIYAYTTAGIQQVSLKQATVIFPDVTDFLSGALIEDFDESALTLSLTSTGGAVLRKKLVFIASRYLIISYGISTFTHALYYDTAYKQWGRLKFTHTDCFAWVRTASEVAKKSIAFLGAGGSINILDSDINSTVSSGVMLLGKYQYVRGRALQLEKVSIENVNVGDTFSLYTLPSIDGKTYGTAVAGHLSYSAGKLREFLFHNTALNHTLILKGQFTAVCAVLDFTVHGDR